jgi:hypothetical protein
MVKIDSDQVILVWGNMYLTKLRNQSGKEERLNEL